jgi:hypothetical protein
VEVFSVKVKKDGKALQRLIRSIESALAAGNTTVKVEMEKRFPDKVTGKPREHDVVLTITHKHHETVIALECRDRSRPVGVDAVEAFHAKCQDTGIHSGIIVSGHGFYKTAVEKAAHYNIGCMSLDEAECFDWCDAAGMELHARHVQHAHLNIIFPVDPDIDRDTIQTADGTLVDGQMISGWGVNALSQYQPIPMEEPGEHRVLFREVNPNVYGIQDGERVQATEVQIRITYTVTVGFSPFSLRTYMDVRKSKQVTQAAVCALTISSDEVADMVLSTNEKGEINAVLVRSPLTGPKTPAVGTP